MALIGRFACSPPSFWAAAFLICCPVPLICQGAPEQDKPAIEVPAAPPGSGNEVKQQSCPVINEGVIPTKSTIEAKVTGTLEASCQKAGKKLWVNSIFEMDFPECRMLVGAPIYGSVTAASSTKNPRASELSFEFHATDCLGHDKQPMQMVVIGVFAPPGEQVRALNAVPTEVEGGARQITDTVASTSGYDANLDPAWPRA